MIRTEQRWPGLRDGGVCDHKGTAEDSFWGVMELFFILIAMVATQIYTCVKIHRTEYQKKKKNQFYYMLIFFFFGCATQLAEF